MDKIVNFSSKTWCSECRRYIGDPGEVGAYSDGICPHYGWALLKLEADVMEGSGDFFTQPAMPVDPGERVHEKKEKRMLGQGGGIVAQSAVQFSQMREQAIKSDPIVHRQKDAGVLGMLVGVMLGLCAVVAFFMVSPLGNSTTDSDQSAKGADSTRPTVRVVKTREDVVKFIDAFSELDDVDKILKAIRFPQLLEPFVRIWHEDLGTDLKNLKGLSVMNYSEMQLFGSRYAVVSLGQANGMILGRVFVEIADDGEMRIDWEILVGASDRYWREFSKTRPVDPVPLWVSMHRTTIIDLSLPEGENPDDWMAVRVMGPAAGINGTSYVTLVKKGDAFGDYVERNIPWIGEAPNGRVMAVTAHFTSDSSPMLMIDELHGSDGLRSPTDKKLYPLDAW